MAPDARREENSELQRRIDGRGIGKQTWGIVHKIKEVDDLLSGDPQRQERVREVHPEVSFWAWAGRPMQFRKAIRRGREERRRLIDAYFGEDAFEQVRANYKVKEVGHDDILDAFAALWTAERIHQGKHRTLPEDSHRDSAGLRMEIVY